jgi:hypothetical protein
MRRVAALATAVGCVPSPGDASIPPPPRRATRATARYGTPTVWCSTAQEVNDMHTIRTIALATALAATLAGCSNPYDPGQRALAGGAIGAGTGATIGAIAGGGRGAVAGALIGGALGAIGGAATTPQPPTIENGPGPSYQSPGPYR